ncbi:Hepatocellular carcinoma associated antigen 59 [Echinococcus multilocularis]|uniref:Hepatocellular carcinoma associated antigen 59 n=1 Tax=Echinococcus multilocularis TaxID=6211 RepID=A0A087W154_ECHMU|nr:Hepatocellular carcinoma associated antigen 59 [Echinococcus multilocularis]
MSFRTPKRRHVKSTRFIKDSDSEDEGQATLTDLKNNPSSNLSVEEAVECIRTWQNFRKRRSGVSAESLFVGKKIEPEVLIEDDPFKMKTGGLVDMRGAFRKPMKEEFEDVVRLSRTFTAETNKRDEDADMLKYIETELAKRKGITKTEAEAPKTVIDNILSEIPEALKPKMGQHSEDMLSNQMLCGIPEVDLGVESKMRNIEATEEAKQRLLKERLTQRQKKSSEDLAPFNMSVNFVQHSRWNNYVDQTLHRELTVQLNDNPDRSDVPEMPSIADPPTIEVEKRRLQAEKSTDAKVLQRYKNYMQNKRGR